MESAVVEKPAEVKDLKKRSKYVEKGEKKQGEQERTENKKEHHEHKHDNKDKKRPRREREREERDDDEFNIKASDINETTVIPKLPKPLLKEPKKEDFKAEQTKLVEKIKALQEKKSKISAQKYDPSAGKKGDKKLDEFDTLREQVKQLRDAKDIVHKELEAVKEKIKNVQDQVTDANNELNSFGTGNETIFQSLRKIENQLLTKKLSPKEEKDLTHERDTLRRKVNAVSEKKSVENIEDRIEKLQELKTQLKEQLDVLYAEKKPISEKFNELKEQYTPINDKLNKLKDQRKAEWESQQAAHDEDYKKFKEQKTEKKDQIEINIEKLRDSIDDLWDDFHAKGKEYWKQQRLVKHVEWLTKRKQEYIKFKERERKRAEYEELHKDVPVVKAKKYVGHVKNCETLIEYCKKLNPEEEKQKVQVQQKLSIEEIQNKLSEDTQWKKQKGVTLIQSKKNQDLDVEVTSKKNKKNKKVEPQAQKDTKPKKNVVYAHDIGIRNAFESVKVLCPDTVDDLEKTIQALEQKLVQYNKLNQQQEVEEVKEATTETATQQKPRQTPKQKKQQASKLEIKEEDFPTI